MDEISILSLIYDYGGLVIGLALLVVACLFLPGKIRWYVLTAGLTLIVFRAYQIYSARKKLSEADLERENLREKHNELQGWVDELRKNKEQLQNEKHELEARKNQIQEKITELDEASDSDLEKKKKLDAKARKLQQQGKIMEQQRSRQLSAIRRALELQRQFSNLEENTGNE